MAVSQSLSVTEVSGSVNTTANTSQVRILWTSKQTGSSHNDYTRTAKYYVSINGGSETEYPVDYTLPQNSTKTIVDVTITVPHKNDGTGTVSVRTWMDTAISAGVVQKSRTLSLTTIPRASTITAAYAVTLGSGCKITWTPASSSFYYKVKFAIGTWSYTTKAFCPGITTAYTYTGYTIPYEVANNFPDDPSGTMIATLYTYADSGITQVGSESSSSFTVTLPENETTKPSIRMTLSPVTPYEKFKSLYLKGVSRVKATFEGEGKYGASIVAYSLQAESGRYIEPYTSDILSKSGDSTIIGYVSDSRWFGNNTSQTINVIAYDAPYISTYYGYNKVICERCTEDGKTSDSGTYLHVQGTRNYTKINTNGIVNTCRVRCRYKPEGGKWSHGIGEGVIVLSSDTTTDEFDVILPDIVSDPKVIYTVELNIVDDTNLPVAIQFYIPSEYVDFELREGGKGAGFGKHATEANLLDCDWNAKFRKKVIIGDDEVVDFVVAEGTEDIWHYRKWRSGKVECWGRRSVEVDISTEWGSAVYYGIVDPYAFPTGLFTDVPMCQATAEHGSTLQAAWMAISGKTTKDSAPSVMFCRPMIETAGFIISYYAIGTWQ